VRRASSQPAIVASNRNPAQLIAGAAHGCASTCPSSGMSVRAFSQMRSGCACSSQSGCALASPAQV
jgi:hypothetical protein